MTVKEQTGYRTRDGSIAYVWHWGRRGEDDIFAGCGKACFVGTVQDGGFNYWDSAGKDISGERGWDLVEELG